MTPLDDFQLRLTLTDGSVVERDVEPLLVGPVFEAVRDNPDVFRAASSFGVVLLERDPRPTPWSLVEAYAVREPDA